MNFFIPYNSHNDESTPLGRVICGKYCLNQEEVLRVHRYFLTFYENRGSMLKKVAYQKKIDKYAMMQDIFKNLKCTETKITYGSAKSKEALVQEKKTFGKEKSVANLKNSANEIRDQEIIRDKSYQRLKEREKISKTPKLKRKVPKLDSSYHSSKSISRPHSRIRMRQQNSIRDLSVGDSKAINADQISDLSILNKARDILGQFSLISNKSEKSGDLEEKKQKSMPIERSEKPEKYEKNEGNITSKLIYQKKTRLNSVSSKNIDEKLKKAADLVKQNKIIDDFNSEEIVVDVGMSNGKQKTLIIPPNSDQRQAVSKFVKENNLSPEMGRTLLNSILNS